MNLNKKYIIFLLFLGLFLSTNPSSAAYEVIKAKTIKNDSIEVQQDEYSGRYTFNDPELPDFVPEEAVLPKFGEKMKKLFSRKKKQKFEEPDIVEEDNVETRQMVSEKKVEEPVSDKNRFQINADEMTYDDNEGNVYAHGHVEIIAKEQDIVLKADDAVLNRVEQKLHLKDNVKIVKDGAEMVGQYLVVDLNEQNILMDNPTLEAYSFEIKAQEGYLIANDIQMLNGDMHSTKNSEYIVQSRGFMNLEPMGLLELDDRLSDIDADPSVNRQRYRLKAKEIIITSYKDHDTILFKKSNIYYNNHRIVRNMDIEVIADKDKQVIEVNAPEAGNLRGFGLYAGYGFVTKLPKGQTLKLMPALTYGESTLGVGLLARHRSRNSLLEAGWSTSIQRFVSRGAYNLGNSFKIRYGTNAYIPEGFLGSRRSGYAAQLEWIKSYQVPDLQALFQQGVYAGLYSDYYKNNGHRYSTSRFRYMAQLSRPFFTYENKEQDVKIVAGLVSQGVATLYGSGQTVGLARFGPFLLSKKKHWESMLAYYITGVHGDSPFMFDKYRYGVHAISFNEKFNITNKIALGYRATISPQKDNVEGDLLTESRIYAMVGPQDLKLAFSYDFVRDMAHLDIMFFVGTESTKINFDKLITKDVDGSIEKRDFYKKTRIRKVKEEESL